MINDKQLQLENFILGEKSLDRISQIWIGDLHT